MVIHCNKSNIAIDLCVTNTPQKDSAYLNVPVSKSVTQVCFLDFSRKNSRIDASKDAFLQYLPLGALSDITIIPEVRQKYRDDLTCYKLLLLMSYPIN